MIQDKNNAVGEPGRKSNLFSSLSKDAAITVVVLGSATITSWVIARWSGIDDNIGVIYVLAVVLISRFTAGYFWGIAASAAGVIGTNYYFTYPYHTVNFTLSGYPVTFFSMLVVSLVTSTLTVQSKEHAQLSALREQRTETLYKFTRRLLALSGVEKIVNLTLEYLYRFSHTTVIFYTKDPVAGGTGVMKSAASRHEAMLCSGDEREVVHQVFLSGKRTGAGTKICPEANGLYLPVIAQGHMLGAAGLFYEKDELPEEDMLTFLDMLISQAAMALERQRLSDEQQAIVVEAEKEKMRTNLLRSVSHDLRTPLTSIIGASSAILENKGLVDPETRDKLIGDIHEEAEWLIRMVENLLTVTRISGGPATVNKQPEAAEEIVAGAVGRIKSRFAGAKIHVSVPEEFLMVPMDATLIEQVIINLLENAIRHAGTDQPIDLTVSVAGDQAVFEVCDKGRGLSEEEIPHIFDGYPCADNKRRDSSKGAGVGLSICMAIVKAHRGSMSAANRPGGGAVFSFQLPIKEADVNE